MHILATLEADLTIITVIRIQSSTLYPKLAIKQCVIKIKLSVVKTLILNTAPIKEPINSQNAVKTL